MDKPRVILLLPRYSDVSFGSAKAAIMATSGGVEQVGYIEGVVSATPHNFNGLLAAALDMRDRGEATHVAMLHSDVAPEPGWLDVLWDELRSHRLDLISAVVPIKEPGRQRTSTAIGDEFDPWCPKRYILMGDRAGLPGTFATDDVCEPGEVLLVNTGCFLADLRRPYWDHFAFQFGCRITRRDGRRIAQLNPEDWQMSRHLHAAGAPYGATWKVELVHHGAAEWPNR